ncbi:alpha/beta hydrolase [Bacillus cereus group sp. BfR-BA-01380]|uniref:alpha/beta hydrolase n=1 Tax=Bacillus cereus group sp. BfR-BA-01380 TaxID=2920324 RepID=UPI001F573B9C|nr:alpha/beta hydrolase [Bacillus cereus group sp. BfR-BA-01380]
MITHVEILDKKVEVLITGQGTQAVVIQTGMFCSFYNWIEVANELSPYYKVVLFHRPGYGTSELNERERTTEQTAYELRELLRVLHIQQPIILVGHSYGGLCVQHFTMLYPEQVTALVLVDSTSMNLHRLDELDLPTLDETDSDEKWIEKCLYYADLNTAQLKQEVCPKLTAAQTTLPVEIQKLLLAFPISPALYKAVSSEIIHWKDCAQKMKSMQLFPNVPLIIIGRDAHHSIQQVVQDGIPYEEAAALETVWQELIHEQTTLSKQSQFVVAANSGHSIEIDRPDIVIEAIKNLHNL